MNKSIFAGLVILAVAGGGSTATPAASTAASTAVTPAAIKAVTPAAIKAVTPAASTACVVSLNAPQCQSTAPDLTVDWVSAGDTSGCTFTWSINWGDRSAAQQVTVDGQQEAGEYFLADHTYQATHRQTYSITTSDVSVTGRAGICVLDRVPDQRLPALRHGVDGQCHLQGGLFRRLRKSAGQLRLRWFRGMLPGAGGNRYA